MSSNIKKCGYSTCVCFDETRKNNCDSFVLIEDCRIMNTINKLKEDVLESMAIIQAYCGHHDAVHGCRLILKECEDLLEKIKKT